MGIFLSKSNKEAPIYGDNLKSEMKDFISKTEMFLREESHKDKNTLSHLKIIQSIDKDLNTLKLCSEKGGNLKIGIISRSEDSKDLIKTIYLEELHDDTSKNTLISSKSIKHLTILNNNNLQQIQAENTDSDQQMHLKKLISKSFSNNRVKSENIIITKIFPTNPDIINDNLIVTCSSNLKPIICLDHAIVNNSSSGSAISDHIEIDIDEMNKFLLFSALHDLLIYLPDSNNLSNEITYLNLLSDNMLILKLLRRGNFFMVNRKSYPGCKAIDIKLDDLVLRLGNSVIHELDYEQAEEDKVKYLGVMIEHNSSSYAKDLPIEIVARIKKKFDEFLRKKDYEEYICKFESEERKEEIKALKDLKYVIKTIPKLEYSAFKKAFINKYISYIKINKNNFSSTSGLDHLEERLTHSFLEIINNKFNLLRSNISFKLMLWQNLEELESSRDFTNSLIFTRNKMVEDIEKSFVKITDVFEKEESYLFENCDNVMNNITRLRHNAINLNGTKSFFDIFDPTGNFVPYNDYLTELRRSYYSFNSVIFGSIGKISNRIDKILEILSMGIASNYTSLFIEVEKNNLNNLSDKMRNFSELYTNPNCLNIEDIIHSKIDKINLLAINLFSAFGFSNFSLDRTFPYYLISSYGGTFISLSSPIFGASMASSFIFFVTSIIFAKYLEYIYRRNSRENFLTNSEKLLNFMALKKDRIKYFKNDVEEFCKIYSKETLELIDLILGI